MVQRSDREATRESSDWVSLVAAFFAAVVGYMGCCSADLSGVAKREADEMADR
jgi:hypothetical protein